MGNTHLGISRTVKKNQLGWMDGWMDEDGYNVRPINPITDPWDDLYIYLQTFGWCLCVFMYNINKQIVPWNRHGNQLKNPRRAKI